MILAGSDIEFTVRSSPSVRTAAFITADIVSAGSTIEARIRRTIVDVNFAGCSGESFATIADEFIVEINASVGSNRVAGVAQTLVDLSLALESDKSWSALADETVQLINARASVLARLRCAVVDRMLTLFTGVSGLAGASVVVDTVDALTVVVARLCGTFVYIRFTSLTCPSWMTYALVSE